MQLEIVEKSSAASLLEDGDFLAQWSELYERCPWATVMQSPGFACAWYSAYRSRVDPVLVVSRGGDGRLSGLLTLALSSRAGLVVAGAHQAEYQVWITTPEMGDDFALRAIRAIRHRFPSRSLAFRYLPPNAPLRWLSNDPEASRLSLLTPHRRPLMRLGDGSGIATKFKRRSIRSRANRLRQMGSAGIERVTEASELEAMFDEIIAYHDFRRISVSGRAPFAMDPLKRAFHVELLRRGLLDCTVLRIGGRVLSTQLDVPGRNEEHLALGAYAPWIAKLSPGTIHTLELARLLLNRGTERIDFTPGGDSYKEDFATEWDEVHTLTLFPRRRARQAARVVRALEGVGRWACRRVNTTPVQATVLAGELRQRPAATVARAFRNTARRLRSTDAFTLFLRPAAPLGPAGGGRTSDGARGGDVPQTDGGVRLNVLEHFSAYHPTGLDEPRQGFVATAAKRFAEGMQAYTRVDAGRLSLCAWVTDAPEDVLEGDVCGALPPSQRRVLLFDVRRFGSSTPGRLEASIGEVLADCAEPGTAATTLVVVPRGDVELKRAVEQLGFVPAAEVVKTTRLGRRSQSARLIEVPQQATRQAALRVTSTVSAAMSWMGEHLIIAL